MMSRLMVGNDRLPMAEYLPSSNDQRADWRLTGPLVVERNNQVLERDW
jgi:hypothetical protein